MSVFVNRAAATVAASARVADAATSLRLIPRNRTAAPIANGATPAAQRRASDAAVAPVKTPTSTAVVRPTARLRGRPRKARYAASTAAPKGGSTWKITVSCERNAYGPTTSAVAPAVTPAQSPATRAVAQPSRTTAATANG